MQVLGVLIAIALVATLVSLVLGSIFGDDPMLGLGPDVGNRGGSDICVVVWKIGRFRQQHPR